jgi:hypothetical protein
LHIMVSVRLAIVSAAIVVAAGLPDAQGVAIKLTDVSVESGLDLINVSGGAAKDYIVDANGNGAAFFDYDNDSDLDVLIVNGSTRERLAQGGDPMVALYRNEGVGRFADVTAASGFDRKGWAAGTCIADYDNDGFEDVYVTAFGGRVVAKHRERIVRRCHASRRPWGYALEHQLCVWRLRS